jgi:hypothetical protein
LGIRAERAMLAATRGVNTHRGAIFTLGLLAATAGALAARSLFPTDQALRSTLVAQWGADLATDWRAPNAPSHGSLMAARYGARGARGQALRGFPPYSGVASARGAAARGGPRRATRGVLRVVEASRIRTCCIAEGRRASRYSGAADLRTGVHAQALPRAPRAASRVHRPAPLWRLRQMLSAALFVDARKRATAG